jgi:hypothetical protein
VAWPCVFPQQNPLGVTRRPGCAKHQLEQGQDIRTIQELLAHKAVSTIMIYTHRLNPGPLKGTKPSQHSLISLRISSRTRDPWLSWSSVLEVPLRHKELQGMAHWMHQWFSDENGRQALVLGTSQ